MKINIEQTYLSATDRKSEIERQLAELDEILKTPERTLDDIILHIRLLKEYKLYL